MNEWIKYKWELRRLEKLRVEHLKKTEAAVDRAKQRGYDDGELSSVGQDEYEIENWIKFYQTQYYSHQCKKFVLPMPDVNNNEYYSKFNFDDDEGDRLILTTKGFKYARDLIHDERKRRRESWGFWLTMATGLIGALIGLVSVFKS